MGKTDLLNSMTRRTSVYCKNPLKKNKTLKKNLHDSWTKRYIRLPYI